jgi:thiol-disulfide isomerase/thioredoxin
MNRLSLLAAVLFLLAPAAWAATAAPPASIALPAASPTADLKALIARVQAKLQQGKETAADFAEEISAFDALLAKYSAQKTDEVAQILYAEASLYAQIFNDSEKALQLVRRIKSDFPDTKVAGEMDRLIAGLEAEAKAAQIQAALIGKPAPELHFKWSNVAGLKTLSALKGKVVILDFWATWCGPCVASFPNVRELAAHYQDLDVAIVGVTSLQGMVRGLTPDTIDTKDDPARELALMTDYIKAKEITWTVAFSEEEVFNSDYGIRGIPYIAIVAPDGTVRRTGLHPSMPAGEKYAMIDAILKEFGKKLPAAAAVGK